MARALLLVLTNPSSPQEEAEFNTWYDEIHVAEVTSLVPGVVAASRYRVDDLTRRSRPGATEDEPDRPLFPQRYAAIYEIEADDPAAVVRDLRVKAAEGRFQMSPTLDRAAAPPALVLLTPLDQANVAHHQA